MTGDDVRPSGGSTAPDGVSAAAPPAAGPPVPGPTPADPPAAPARPEPAPAGPQVPDRPQPAPAPDAETLAAIATPATVRRAPRIGPFIATGVVLGAVVAWVLVLVASGTTGEARTAVALVVTTGGAILGGLVGAALATAADRRSARR